MKNGHEKLGLGWRWRKAAAVAIALMGTVAIGSFIPQVEAQQRDKLGLPLPGAPVEAADPAKMAFPLPDKPSIAILPFDIISSDPELVFVGDGLTENLTAALSKLPGLFVIARNSASVYKGRPVSIRQVAEDLGVRFVFEGSVQLSGEDLRVTAQLIDAVNGFHIWSERYDRKLDDVFDVQDEITLNIVQELDVELLASQRGAVLSRQTENLEAWGLHVEADAYHLQHLPTPDGLVKPLRPIPDTPYAKYGWPNDSLPDTARTVGTTLEE